LSRAFPLRAAAAALAVLSACGRGPSGIQPIFVEGRAVATAGDSLYALTGAARPDLWVKNQASGQSRELGSGVLKSPAHAQWHGGEWYVSDVENGKAVIVVLGPDGSLRRRIPLGRHSDTPHQFAVLPDARIVVEGRGGRLIALRGDTTATFAVTGQSSRTGLLIGASGGVIHAVPDQYITLYNEFGHIRWRIDWPWAGTAFVTDLSVDGNARVHAIAGVPSQGTFVVYTLSTQTGEVVRWSIPGRAATFTVDPLGRLEPGKAEDWTK
jgi:hypothetical protein